MPSTGSSPNHGVDLVHFRKGERKDDIAQRYLVDHDGGEGPLFVRPLGATTPTIVGCRG